MNLLIYYFLYFFLIISALGYGVFYLNISKLNLLDFNLGQIGIIGLFFLTFFAMTIHWFFPLGFFINISIHLFGFYFFFKNQIIFRDRKKNINNLLVFFFISIALLISKNHDDFPYYHLPLSLNFSENKIQFGLHNLNYAYAHLSSIFFLNSTTYLPIVKFNLFHSVNLIFYSFIILIILDDIKNFFVKKKFSSEFFLKLLLIIFFLVKFSRLGEFGTDIIGQMLIMYAMANLFDPEFYKNETKTLFTFSIIIFSLTLKTYFFLYFLIIFFIFYTFKFNQIIKLFVKNYFFLVILFCLYISFVFKSAAISGCLIYPIQELCFSDFKWSISKYEVADYKLWYEFWSKAGAGPSHKFIGDMNEYVSNFVWFPNWIKYHFFPHVIESVGLLLFISILIVTLFTRNSKKTKKKKTLHNFFLIEIFFSISIFWLYKHPTMRYGGFACLGLLIFSLTSSLLENRKFNPNYVKRISTLLIILSFSIFLLKNIGRIYRELNTHDHFSRFPYFYVGEPSYKSIQFENYNINVVSGDSCWSVPSPCGDSSEITVDNIYNYIFYIKKK
jgi:hypothetical protein